MCIFVHSVSLQCIIHIWPSKYIASLSFWMMCILLPSHSLVCLAQPASRKQELSLISLFSSLDLDVCLKEASWQIFNLAAIHFSY